MERKHIIITPKMGKLTWHGYIATVILSNFGKTETMMENGIIGITMNTVKEFVLNTTITSMGNQMYGGRFLTAGRIWFKLIPISMEFQMSLAFTKTR